MVDVYGDHAILCGAGGDRARRHHRIRNLLGDFLVAAGQSVTYEPMGLLPLFAADRAPCGAAAAVKPAAQPGPTRRRAAAGPLRRPGGAAAGQPPSTSL